MLSLCFVLSAVVVWDLGQFELTGQGVGWCIRTLSKTPGGYVRLTEEEETNRGTSTVTGTRGTRTN